MICEDAWVSVNLEASPIRQLIKKGISLLIVLSASPYEINKDQSRLTMFSNIAKQHKLKIIASKKPTTDIASPNIEDLTISTHKAGALCNPNSVGVDSKAITCRSLLPLAKGSIQTSTLL